MLVGEVVRVLKKNGTLSLAGPYMTPIPKINYARHLHDERTVTSFANATRAGRHELLQLAGQIRIRGRTQAFPLAEAKRVLQMPKASKIEASAVLEMP